MSRIIINMPDDRVAICDTLDKAHRKFMQSIRQGGVPPMCHPTKRHTRGRLRHYDFSKARSDRALNAKFHHENILQRMFHNAQSSDARYADERKARLAKLRGGDI